MLHVFMLMSVHTLRCYSFLRTGASVSGRVEAKQIENQCDAITVHGFIDSAQP